ncbi:MAG: PepSY domain-containing protein [Vicinamibacterales bacterium]
MTSVRRLVLITHRWLGLGSSLVLSIAGVTGAFLVWPGSYPIRRLASRLHDTLALGAPGQLIVLIATWAAVILNVGGLYLWWRKKTITVRTTHGLRPALLDLHHAAGALGVLLMLSIAIGAIGMQLARPRSPELLQTFSSLHTGGRFPIPIKILYTAGSMIFAVQGVTGVVMWWKTRSGRIAT